MQIYKLVLIGQNFELWPINVEVLKSQDWIVFISTVQPELTFLDNSNCSSIEFNKLKNRMVNSRPCPWMPINDLTDSSLGYINHLIGRKYLLPLNQAIYHKEGLMHATSINPKVPSQNKYHNYINVSIINTSSTVEMFFQKPM